MSAIPDGTLADCEQLVADLQRQLAECRAERDEAIEYQTATSEVLNVISRSISDLQPVLDQWSKRPPGFAAPIPRGSHSPAQR